MRDLAAAERAAADLLRALGLQLDTESLRDTPRRMAHAYAELLTPRAFDLTTFPNDEGYDELVLARAIPVQSLCEHHLLPFVGVAHVGYLPGERILGLSKLARVVELFARGPQVQERLTKQVADWLQEPAAPARRRRRHRGRAPVHDAARRAGRAAPARVTSALHGTLREDAASRAEFLALDRSDTAPGRPTSEHAREPFVIVGAGLAGAKAAETLRAEGFDGRRRPGRRRAGAPVRAAAAVQGLPAGHGRARAPRSCTAHGWYAEHDVELRTGVRGRRRLDRPPTRLTLDGGERLRLRPAAAGHRVRAAPARPCRARTSTACRYLRTLADTDRLLADLADGGAAWSSSAPAGSGWRSPRPPGRAAPR